MPILVVLRRQAILIAAIVTPIAFLLGSNPSAVHAQADDVVVRIESADGGFQLTRNGQPYFIKGVGGDGSRKVLVEAGGNSIRTWGTDNLQTVLDDAQKLGLSVTVGFWLGHERHGFNYNDAQQIAAQAEKVKTTVEKFKRHPAVLIWALGNEMEGAGDNAAIWLAINHLATLVKRIDPHHPTMTVVAEIGGNKVKNLHRLCPDIDILGINSYAGGASVPRRYSEAGGTKPYILTEFGPAGTWESPKNSWGLVPELTSTEKALAYRKAYEQAVANQKGKCLGSYAFLWGTKQEATATWFGILLPDGTRLGAADVLTEMWTGKPPRNLCPRIDQIAVTGTNEVEPQSTISVTLKTSDPEKDSLKVRWKLQKESESFGQGGDAEAIPPDFPKSILKGGLQGAEIKLPQDGGSYRVFAFVTDDHGGGAVANVPVRVKGPSVLMDAKSASLPLVIYAEPDGPSSTYVPAGWMGNNKALKLTERCETNPHAGKHCLRVDYTANDNWSGVVWQSPANDWGDLPGGWNLTGAKRLTFWARGERGGEMISCEFGILAKDKRYHDTGHGKLEKLKLTTDWQQFTIDISKLDLTRIKTGFVFTVAGDGRPITFYFDDIQYE